MRRKAIKLICTGAVLCCFLFGLTGCATYYDSDDVAEYIHDVIGLETFDVSKNHREFVDEDHHSDQIWDVYVPELDVTFQVVNDVFSSGEFADNRLGHNFFSVWFLAKQDELPLTGGIRCEQRTGSQGQVEVELVGEYRNLQELNRLYDGLMSLRGAVASQEMSDLSLPYELTYAGDNRMDWDNTFDDVDMSGNIKDLWGFDELKDRYVRFLMDYELPELENISQADKEAAVRTAPSRLGIRRDAGMDPVYYTDLVPDSYGTGVSYSTLYHVLQKEGYDVSGSALDFTFMGVDESVYHMTYGSYDMHHDGTKERLSCYYLKDGFPVWESGWRGYHISLDDIELITGLDLVSSSYPAA